MNPEFIAEFEGKPGVEFRPHPMPPSPRAEREDGGERGQHKWQTGPELWERLKPVARQMRKEPTKAEEILWERLRYRRLGGFKFRRQHSIERFIVDFYCSQSGLVVEIDGPIHQYQKEEDEIRQKYIESQGFHVLRFSSDDVIQNIDNILQQISSSLNAPSSPAERGPGGEVSQNSSVLDSPSLSIERKLEVR